MREKTKDEITKDEIGGIDDITDDNVDITEDNADIADDNADKDEVAKAESGDKGKRVRLINIRPLCITALCLIFGILSAYYSITISIFIGISAIILIFAFIICCFCIFRKKKILIYTLLIVAVFSLGFSGVIMRYDYAASLPTYKNSGIFSGKIVKKSVKRKSDSTIYIIDFENCVFDGVELKGKTTAFITEKNFCDTLDIGDVVRFDKAKLTLNATQKDYIKNAVKGDYYNVKISSKPYLIETEADFYEILFLKLRKFYRNNMSDESAALAIALTTGDTSYLGEESLDVFRMAGIAHVFAVSGLHIGIFVTILLFLADKLKIGRKTTFIFVMLPTFLYCGLCGFRQSAMRAFFMAAVMLSADLIGFKNDRLSSAAIAAIILLLVNPMGIFDVGFKLSFVAVISIFVLMPPIKRRFCRLKHVGEPLSVSLAAQLGTLPLLTDMSGYMSIIAVFANVIFVPLVSFAYMLLFGFTLLGLVENLIFGGAVLSLFLPDKLLFLINEAINFVNFRLFILPAHFGNIKYLWYFGLFAACDLLNIPKKSKFITFSLCAVVTAIFIFI